MYASSGYAEAQLRHACKLVVVSQHLTPADPIFLYKLLGVLAFSILFQQCQ